MLQLRDVAITYQNMVPAVQGVTLEVPDRQVVTLLGANGAGKTTIFRAITGLLPIHHASLTSGSILFEGRRIDGLSPTQIVARGIAQVLEGRRLPAYGTLIAPSTPTSWSGIVADRRPAGASIENSWPVFGCCSSCGRRVSAGARRMPNSSCCPLGGGDSGASGSTPGLPPIGAGASGASLNSPPAALSQINTETVSPTAIFTSGGGASSLKRSANLSLGWAISALTTRSSTGTTSKRISPPARPWSRTSLVDGPALGIQEHPATDKAIRQNRQTKSFIDSDIVNQRGKPYHERLPN